MWHCTHTVLIKCLLNLVKKHSQSETKDANLGKKSTEGNLSIAVYTYTLILLIKDQFISN